MKYFLKLLPFLTGWLLLLATDHLRVLGTINGLLQMVLFLFVVCIPAWRTERMSYVDIGWPWGLVVIGGLSLYFGYFGEGNPLRVALIAGAYIFMGGRMGFFAVKLWRAGALRRELPRYQYQAIRWERSGERNVPVARQVEVLIQGLANASFLAFPAFIVIGNPASSMGKLEILGFGIVAVAFALESLADFQKASFVTKAKAAGDRLAVCDVGLWRYSRHPNYFFEWMVWNGLILATIPSLPHLFETESLPLAALLTAGLFFVSRLMYVTLVHYTGAKPSEFFSAQKRPGYADYQRTTNMFFPGPRRT